MSNRPTNILVVEDEPGFASVLKTLLADGCNSHFEVTLADNLAVTLQHLRENAFDVVLLDLSLPDTTGLDTYKAVAQTAPSVPVVVMSGLNNETIAVQAVREGAQDYLVKGQFEHRAMERAIRYAVERKRIEKKLRESEEFFRLISENVTDMIAVLDANGKRIYNSPSYEKVLGEPASLCRTDSFQEIHPDDRDNIKSLFHQVVASGKGRRAEYRFQRNDGEVRHVESESNVITDGTGHTERVVVVSRDVSDRVRAENETRKALAEARRAHEQLQAAQQRIVQAERLEAVSTFAAAVAHEVKNPLQTIVLGLDCLGDSISGKDETSVAILKQMTAAVEKADAFIRGLLEFSTHKKRDLQEHALDGLLQNSLKTVEAELKSRGITLVREFCPDAPLLRMDDRSITHVFVTLLTHEVHCMNGGTLRVRTSTVTAPEDGQRMLVAEIESRAVSRAAHDTAMARKMDAQTKFRLMVSKKVLELYGGKVDHTPQECGGRYTISFKT